MLLDDLAHLTCIGLQLLSTDEDIGEQSTKGVEFVKHDLVFEVAKNRISDPSAHFRFVHANFEM